MKIEKKSETLHNCCFELKALHEDCNVEKLNILDGGVSANVDYQAILTDHKIEILRMRHEHEREILLMKHHHETELLRRDLEYQQYTSEPVPSGNIIGGDLIHHNQDHNYKHEGRSDKISDTKIEQLLVDIEKLKQHISNLLTNK